MGPKVHSERGLSAVWCKIQSTDTAGGNWTSLIETIQKVLYIIKKLKQKCIHFYIKMISLNFIWEAECITYNTKHSLKISAAKEAQTLNSASSLRYLALNIVAVFFSFFTWGQRNWEKVKQTLTCWSSPDSRHSWTCLTFLTTVKSYNREDNIYQINLRHRKPRRISKSNRFDKGDDLEKSGMKITKIGKDM